jgi:hypothetical protein
MRIAAALVVVGLIACKDKPKVQMIASSCPSFAACSAECDQEIVVACDRAAPIAPDATTRLAVYRKAYEMWARTCEFGMPEACLNATHASLRSRGSDPLKMSRAEIAADKEACEYFEIFARANGQSLPSACP